MADYCERTLRTTAGFPQPRGTVLMRRAYWVQGLRGRGAASRARRCAALPLHPLSFVQVRKALRYLEGEHLLASQDVKFKKPRQPKGEAAAAAGGQAAGWLAGWLAGWKGAGGGACSVADPARQ